MHARLPEGFLVGHWTHPLGHTGCTVVLVPTGAVAGTEVRGGGPGTRETDVLAPSSAPRDVHAVLLTGGSAFGLAAADGVVRWLAEREYGHLTRSGIRVPLVPAAVCFDGGALDPAARPDAAAGRAACDAASAEAPLLRGRVGAGAGVAAGKLLGPEGWTRTGLGVASDDSSGALVTVLAVANPVGEIVDADGTVLAGARDADGVTRRTIDLLRDGHGMVPAEGREATVLVAVLTDAALDRTGAWLLARAATTGVARAVHPVATPYDGDIVFTLARGGVQADPFALQASVAEAAAAAVRDAARP